MFIYFDADKWLKKIPRPERSGCISVVIAMCLLYELVTPSYPLEHFCQLLPWGCPVTLTQETQPEKHPHIALVLGNGPGDDSDICHFDVLTDPQMPNQANPMHFKAIQINRKEIASYPSWPNSQEWQDVPWKDATPDPNVTYTSISVRTRDDQLDIRPEYNPKGRWHCPALKPSKTPAGQKMSTQPA